MNSAVRRLFLFFFSFAALTACDDPKDIGIDLQDENLIGTEFTDTLTIRTGTVLQTDSILSFRTASALAGQYIDPVLGKTRASLFTEVALNGTSLNFGANTTPDSLVLTLDYSFKYADTLNTTELNVYELDAAFEERMSYFTNTPFAYKDTPLGSKKFQPRVEVVTTDGTTSRRTRLLKVVLSNELASRILAQSGQTALTNQASFLNFFKGIAVIPSENANGSVIGFNLSSTNSNLILYYKGEDGTQKNHTFLLGNGNYFSQVAADRSATALADLQAKGDIIDAEATGKDTYVQAGTQLLTKLYIPYLNSLQTAQKNVIINRAELLVPVKAASMNNNLPAPPQMVLYEANSSNGITRDVAGTPRTVQRDGVNPFLTGAPAVMLFNQKNNKSYYSLNVTSYVQAVVMGQKPNNGLLMGAAVVSSESLRPELNPYRTIITNDDANPVRLLVYYSKLQ